MEDMPYFGGTRNSDIVVALREKKTKMSNIYEEELKSIAVRVIACFLTMIFVVGARPAWGEKKELITGVEKEEIERLYEQAQKAVTDQELDKAVELYTKIIKTDSRNAEACLIRGIIYRKQNKIELAEDDRRCVKLLVPDFDTNIISGKEGWYLILLGIFEEAKLASKWAFKRDGENYAWALNLGHTYLLTGDENTARNYYDKALELYKGEDDFRKDVVAAFDLFIHKNWQVEESKRAKNWMIRR